MTVDRIPLRDDVDRQSATEISISRRDGVVQVMKLAETGEMIGPALSLADDEAVISALCCALLAPHVRGRRKLA